MPRGLSLATPRRGVPADRRGGACRVACKRRLGEHGPPRGEGLHPRGVQSHPCPLGRSTRGAGVTIPGVTTVVVAVPVHNEAELLDRCLSALSVAAATAARRGIRCVVRIVLDGCTDGSR